MFLSHLSSIICSAAQRALNGTSIAPWPRVGSSPWCGRDCRRSSDALRSAAFARETWNAAAFHTGLACMEISPHFAVRSRKFVFRTTPELQLLNSAGQGLRKTLPSPRSSLFAAQPKQTSLTFSGANGKAVERQALALAVPTAGVKPGSRKQESVCLTWAWIEQRRTVMSLGPASQCPPRTPVQQMRAWRKPAGFRCALENGNPAKLP